MRTEIYEETIVEISKWGEGYDAIMEAFIEGQYEGVQSVHESIRQAWDAFERLMHDHALRCPTFDEVEVETDREGCSSLTWNSSDWEFPV